MLGDAPPTMTTTPRNSRRNGALFREKVFSGHDGELSLKTSVCRDHRPGIPVILIFRFAATPYSDSRCAEARRDQGGHEFQLKRRRHSVPIQGQETNVRPRLRARPSETPMW